MKYDFLKVCSRRQWLAEMACEKRTNWFTFFHFSIFPLPVNNNEETKLNNFSFMFYRIVVVALLLLFVVVVLQRRAVCRNLWNEWNIKQSIFKEDHLISLFTAVLWGVVVVVKAAFKNQIEVRFTFEYKWFNSTYKPEIKRIRLFKSQAH